MDKGVFLMVRETLWKADFKKDCNVAVIGLGYVGLTLSVTLSAIGHNVVGVDKNNEIVRSLKHAEPHIHEIGLGDALKASIKFGRLSFTTILPKQSADVYIICVQTPIDSNNKPVLTYLLDVVSMVGKVLKHGNMVIIRSTVPIGTVRNMVLPLLEKESKLIEALDFYLANAPERTVAGKALKELTTLPQIVGGASTISAEMASDFFHRLTDIVIDVGKSENAEMVKLIDNSYRNVMFAYANEVALICNRFGLDATKIINHANDGYFRNKIPLPSPGVGGTCLKKDPYILIHSARSVGFTPTLIRDARWVNDHMVGEVTNKVKSFCKPINKKSRGVKIFVMGFAFKGVPETSDIRDSITLDLIRLLSIFVTEKIYGYDPIVKSEVIKSIFVIPVPVEEGFKDADCVLIMNNHESYAKLDILPLLSSMKKPGYFFDGWRLFNKDEIQRVSGITYDSVSC